MTLIVKTHQAYSLLRFPILAAAALFSTTALHTQEQHALLANTTVLIIRHAEKPDSGASLTPEGFARAKKYAHYFAPFHAEGETIQINALYAGADSTESVRPRLTLEPLSHAIGVPLNTEFPTGDPDRLVHALSTAPHGDHVLIAWRHKKIPALLKAFGAEPAALLPDGAWPNPVYDWVILLHYDSAGHLQTQKLIHEPDPLP
jgi:hypothetical protein